MAIQSKVDLNELAALIKQWGSELGFSRIGIAPAKNQTTIARFQSWLSRGYQGEMRFMENNHELRSDPEKLLSGVVRSISIAINYNHDRQIPNKSRETDTSLATIARYARGRDYHKIIRRRLQKLADRITAYGGDFGYRAFCDSAPILERSLAEQAGIGWIGKHSNLINQSGGSWFLLGEILCNIPLPIDAPARNHCGNCVACIRSCPTQAIVAPYVVDARKCIAYHTIELKGPIPIEYRPAIGNRVFGCDICQAICPWNRHAQTSKEIAFASRFSLHKRSLLELFTAGKEYYRKISEGSPLRRLGYDRWLRNLAVGLGNAKPDSAIQAALNKQVSNESALVQEHVQWALARQAGGIGTR